MIMMDRGLDCIVSSLHNNKSVLEFVERHKGVLLVVQVGALNNDVSRGASKKRQNRE
jgi:hypothetical protein